MTTYTETDCTFQHEGQSFESGGAEVTEEYAIGYPKWNEGIQTNNIRVTNWHGDETLGVGRITAKWPTPRSYMSSTMYQLRVKIRSTGKWYTGRTAGSGMIWKGRAVKNH
jgi:hypothetical protein